MRHFTPRMNDRLLRPPPEGFEHSARKKLADARTIKHRVCVLFAAPNARCAGPPSNGKTADQPSNGAAAMCGRLPNHAVKPLMLIAVDSVPMRRIALAHSN
jgi:hypothetical protein